MKHKASDQRRKPTLSGTIDRRAKLYSLAAAAAGVSMLALAQPAEGSVVITHKNVPIPLCNYDIGRCPVSVDLNNDGVADFQLSLFNATTQFRSHGTSFILTVEPLQGGGVIASQRPFVYWASALLRGAEIGPSANFFSAKNMTIEQFINCSDCTSRFRSLFGKWGGDHPNRFLGVKFLIKGATHYGWIRLTVDSSTKCCDEISGTITEYGYETVANKRLGAGLAGADSPDYRTDDQGDDQARETTDGPGYPSLGMLALGADGLALWHPKP
jgi:hypothetical protein